MKDAIMLHHRNSISVQGLKVSTSRPLLHQLGPIRLSQFPKVYGSGILNR